MTMKTTLPGQLLHDLRSPLNQIIGYSEILSEEIAGTDAEHIRVAGHRILTLIEENFTALPDDPDHNLSIDEDEEPLAPLVEQPAVAGAGLVLVVDDDAMNRDVLSRRLTRQGHDVRTASSGRDALRVIHEAEFDIVLLDIMMPDMDGYEVLARLKADHRLQDIPVIMISALSELQSVVRCIEAGAEDYLTKPFNPTLLKARIGTSLEKKRGRDRESVLFEQLQQNYTRLQELEHLRDDMRNMIVHDLRTPLTAVLVGVEMLGQFGPLNHTQREMADTAIAGGKTLLGMINDLLDVEKIESGTTLLNYGDLIAEKLVADAIAQVAVLAEMTATILIAEVEGGLPGFRGDENQLSRTLVNLIGNAIKFTPRGTVTISASNIGEAMRFAIRDSGQGIPPEAFERIFEKFGQVESSNRVGTGLGLAFCKLAVEAHGGQISVESTPHVGSTFSFTIPLKR